MGLCSPLVKAIMSGRVAEYVMKELQRPSSSLGMHPFLGLICHPSQLRLYHPGIQGKGDALLVLPCRAMPVDVLFRQYDGATPCPAVLFSGQHASPTSAHWTVADLGFIGVSLFCGLYAFTEDPRGPPTLLHASPVYAEFLSRAGPLPDANPVRALSELHADEHNVTCSDALHLHHCRGLQHPREFVLPRLSLIHI